VVLSAKQIRDDCQRYHCLPSQLDGEDYHLMELLRAIDAAEAQYMSADSKAKAKRPKR